MITSTEAFLAAKSTLGADYLAQLVGRFDAKREKFITGLRGKGVSEATLADAEIAMLANPFGFIADQPGTYQSKWNAAWAPLFARCKSEFAA